MASYKLIQDIEAEDHILGPLTLRQFIFALIAAFCFYICFICINKHAGFLLILFLPPALFFGFFAIPFGRDQPTEIWVLAKLRFFLKPRRRIWDQSGVKQLVTITAPKKIERVLTNGLSAYEVQSRLKTLTNTLDSRGWSVKNANIDMVNPLANSTLEADSDRLVDISNIPNSVQSDESFANDILDEQTNPTALHIDSLITQTQEDHKAQLINQMNSRSPQTTSPQQWFVPQVDDTPVTRVTPTFSNPVKATAADQELLEELKANNNRQKIYSQHLRTLEPHKNLKNTTKTDAPKETRPLDPGIMALVNNNDLSLETISREANRNKGKDLDQDEVVISLH